MQDMEFYLQNEMSNYTFILPEKYLLPQYTDEE